MANSMFQLSIGRRVEVRLNIQRNDIRECIEQALHETLPFTSEKTISISLDITEPEGGVYFERSQLEQVIMNFLDNASKFTPRSGFIKITGYPVFWDSRSNGSNVWRKLDRRLGEDQEPNAFRVDIRDSGPGIPSADLTGIFEEYTSYAGSQDRSGGGLGLAICKLIITQHQGAIWANNVAPQGAVFSFVLPAHNVDAQSSTLMMKAKSVSSHAVGGI
jgi:signal transduction histidine kinase